jgi:hypothetical protein
MMEALFALGRRRTRTRTRTGVFGKEESHSKKGGCICRSGVKGRLLLNWWCCSEGEGKEEEEDRSQIFCDLYMDLTPSVWKIQTAPLSLARICQLITVGV